MYDGVKAMIEKEKKLMAKPTMKTVEVGSHLKSAEDLTGFPVFPPGTKSLLSKCLTEKEWEKCGELKDAHGFTFKEAIFSGCKNVDSGIGVYAGSHDSYKVFAKFMDKVIEAYHGHGKDAKHVSEMDASKINCPPLPAEDAAMIVSTRIRVGRNLADFPLGPALSKAQRIDVEKKVTTALSSFTGDLKG